ncbi:MAG: hypothetical protein KGY99_09930 [Phycisphaerae bacterium]|nr:hypothetical protein [Phycisphaerae bacterium]
MSSVFEFLFKYPAGEYVRGRLVWLSAMRIELRLLLLLALAGGVWWLYRRTSSAVSARRRRVLLALRVAVLLLAVVVVSAPALESDRPDTPRSHFMPVLVDCSRSMSIRDARRDEALIARIDAANRLAFGPKGLLADSGQRTKMPLYAFDETLRRVDEPEALAARGTATNLFAALRDADAEMRHLPVIATVLITDGCDNAGGDPLSAAGLLERRGVPLYVIGVGSPNLPKDYEVLRLAAPRRVRRNTDAELRVTVRHTDLPEPFDVEVLRGEFPVARKTVRPEPDNDISEVHIAFTPLVKGATTYKVRIPPAPGEQVTDNNETAFVLDLYDERLPVLYVEGSPRDEFRFLWRAMHRDKEFRVVGMLRLAEDRFLIQGADDAVRPAPGAPTEKESLRRGFPDTPELLNSFEAVILGDIEADFFTPEQQEMLKTFVEQRGGGLLMLGGVNAFGAGGYAGTPVGNLLPVDVVPGGKGYMRDTFKPEFAEDGLNHLAMQLVDDPVANLQLWRQMPELIGLTRVGDLKPGATMLMSHDMKGREAPVLAVHRAGAGRAAAFTSGGSWYWQMSRPADDLFYEKFWKQMIRWLAVGAEARLDVRTDRQNYARGQRVVLRARVADEAMRPVNDAVVTAVVTDPLETVTRVRMNWVLGEDGVYEAAVTPTIEGAHHVTVEVEGTRWEAVGPAHTGFRVAKPVAEFRNAGLKKDLLRKMAAATGGRYFDAEDAGALFEQIAERTAALPSRQAEPVRKPIWNMPVLLLAMVGLLASEWLIRRRGNLA